MHGNAKSCSLQMTADSVSGSFAAPLNSKSIIETKQTLTIFPAANKVGADLTWLFSKPLEEEI
jgi:hypothetical protein